MKTLTSTEVVSRDAGHQKKEVVLKDKTEMRRERRALHSRNRFSKAWQKREGEAGLRRENAVGG